MAKLGATDTRVERGVGSFEGQFFGYAKRDVRDDPEDLYEYRYDEVGPFKDEASAKAAAEKQFAKIEREQRGKKATSNAAYEEGGAGLRLREIREAEGAEADRLLDTGEVR